MRRVFGALPAVIVSLVAGAAAGCASRTPPSRPPGDLARPPATDPTAPVAPAAPVPARYRSLADAEPALTALEDRRAFDAATLEAASASPDSAVRARAALAAGRIGDERAAPVLRGLLRDDVPDVRESAAFGAGILGVPAMTADLAPLLTDSDTEVAARAAWSISFLEQPSGQAALLTALTGAPADRRPALLFALWRFPTPESAAAVAPFAGDGDSATRVAALYALARRPQASSLPVLATCLKDPDGDAAALCARGLGVLGLPAGIDALAESLDDRRPGVTTNALVALAAILEKNPSGVPAVRASRVTALAGNANPNLAIPALALLRFYVSDREAFRRLWAAASSGSGRRRQVALQAAMAAIPDQALALADAAIASPDPFLRGAAAARLGVLPAPEAASRRAALAKDPEAVVRLKVLEGLDGANPEAIRAARPLVDAALADENVAVRAAALELAFEAQAGSPEAFALLVQAVESGREPPMTDLAMTAIDVAQRTPDNPAARPVVEAAYKSPSTLVSRLARRSLVRKFGADPGGYPWRTYDTGKTVADYAALLAEARSGWTAKVETGRGVFAIRFDGETAPLTVMNFVTLARKAYFDGAPIHRVVPNFVVQDGDPTGTGSGGPGWEIRDELSGLPYRIGTVGMALSGPDTGGSQWFATLSPQRHLDGGYTVFGQLLAGQDVLNRIEQDDRIVRVTVSTGTP